MGFLGGSSVDGVLRLGAHVLDLVQRSLCVRSLLFQMLGSLASEFLLCLFLCCTCRCAGRRSLEGRGHSTSLGLLNSHLLLLLSQLGCLILFVLHLVLGRKFRLVLGLLFLCNLCFLAFDIVLGIGLGHFGFYSNFLL